MKGLINSNLEEDDEEAVDGKMMKILDILVELSILIVTGIHGGNLHTSYKTVGDEI